MAEDPHFDAVVIGSGFGGSVMAFRLAEGGLQTCLLERGKSYPPGSFPRSPAGVKRNFWDPSEGLYGLFNVWSFKGSGALVASGLGGGSLIYANVLIRKDEKWFVKEDLKQGGFEYWPVTRADLEPHYDNVERMLNVQQFPFHLEPYRRAGKTRAMQQAASHLDLEWELPNLAVTFANPGKGPVPGEPINKQDFADIHGRPRYTCRLCGECDIGCNYGSKNTLDFNYLSRAMDQGAEIRTLCEVRGLEPREGGGFSVRYVRHDLQREGKQWDTSSLSQERMTCDRLVLSAGAFGTPYLLLRNRSRFPRLSPLLGSRVSVNGDLLSFLRKSRLKKNGRDLQRVLDPSFGPVITSAIRVPDSLDSGDGSDRGFYVEDGGHPYFVNWLVDGVSGAPSSLARLTHFAVRTVRGLLGWEADRDLGGELSRLLGPTESQSSLPLLSMGRDVPDGSMRLRGKHLEVDWRLDRSEPYYHRVVETGKRIAGALNAEYVENLPFQFLRQVFTAHPLGGCPMGRNQNEGVVDSRGEVFNYPGLYIADSSMLPGPVGPNPSLTIAALADRSAEHICSQFKQGRT